MLKLIIAQNTPAAVAAPVTELHEGAHGAASTVVAHAEPTGLGLNATAWVSVAMLVFLAVLVWKKVPGLIAKSLDAKIDGIRAQLAEAETLRKEAEALRDSYAKKLTDADGEAAEIRAAAEAEAAQMVEKAKADSTALIARRKKMAEEKIAAAERTAIADLRAKAATAASNAAQTLISQGHNADIDAKLVDAAIAKLN
jgi:F-type H+-transporting ATPase subunit b